MAANEADGDPSARPTRSFFTFNPALLLADLSNAALDLYADGMDALERKLVEDLATAGYDMQRITALQQGLSQLFDAGASNLDQAMVSFERLAAVTALAVPPELFMEQALPMPAAAPVDLAEEAAMDADLYRLRAEAAQARQQCLALRQQVRALDADLAAAGGADLYRPLADAVATHKEALMDDVAAIGAATAKLQPLLGRAAALPPGPRGKAAGAMALLPPAEGDAPAVDSRARHHMTASGASLAQLRHLQEQLAPAGIA